MKVELLVKKGITLGSQDIDIINKTNISYTYKDIYLSEKEGEVSTLLTRMKRSCTKV